MEIPTIKVKTTTTIQNTTKKKKKKTKKRKTKQTKRSDQTPAESQVVRYCQSSFWQKINHYFSLGVVFQVVVNLLCNTSFQTIFPLTGSWENHDRVSSSSVTTHCTFYPSLIHKPFSFSKRKLDSFVTAQFNPFVPHTCARTHTHTEFYHHTSSWTWFDRIFFVTLLFL